MCRPVKNDELIDSFHKKMLMEVFYTLREPGITTEVSLIASRRASVLGSVDDSGNFAAEFLFIDVDCKLLNDTDFFRLALNNIKHKTSYY